MNLTRILWWTLSTREHSPDERYPTRDEPYPTKDEPYPAKAGRSPSLQSTGRFKSNQIQVNFIYWHKSKKLYIVYIIIWHDTLKENTYE